MTVSAKSLWVVSAATAPRSTTARLSKLAKGARRSFPSYADAGRKHRGSAASFRLFLQIFDDVGAVLRAGQTKGHSRAGHEGLRIGQPFVERDFVPHDLRIFEGRRIIVAGHRTREPAEDASVLGADLVFVKRMTILAALIDLLAAHGIACRMRGARRQQRRRKINRRPASAHRPVSFRPHHEASGVSVMASAWTPCFTEMAATPSAVRNFPSGIFIGP